MAKKSDDRTYDVEVVVDTAGIDWEYGGFNITLWCEEGDGARVIAGMLGKPLVLKLDEILTTVPEAPVLRIVESGDGAPLEEAWRARKRKKASARSAAEDNKTEK